MRNRCLVANWKMTLPPAGMERYLEEIAGLGNRQVEVVIAPPFPFLDHVHQFLARLGSRVAVSAQDCSDREDGPFTGEVSASMVRQAGAAYVIAGHSERRTIFGEDDETVAAKLRAATAAGLTPILCIGENQSQRERGQTNEVLASQLSGGLQDFDRGSPLWIAYEPVWAIGTGRNATAAQAADAHRHIRERLGSLGFAPEQTILYGGSVTPGNASVMAAEGEIDGFLVGGASLDAAQFRAIYEAFSGAPRKG